MAPEVIVCGEVMREIHKNKKATEQWRTKKIANMKGYSKMCDIWSAGVVMYALLYGQLPFKGLTTLEIKEKIKKHDVMYTDTCSS